MELHQLIFRMVAERLRPWASSRSEPASEVRGKNGVAERWVGICRRDLLDHVIILNQRHLKRLMAEYVCYYREDRRGI